MAHRKAPARKHPRESSSTSPIAHPRGMLWGGRPSEQATRSTPKGLVGRAPPTWPARDATRPRLPMGGLTGNRDSDSMRQQPRKRVKQGEEERKGGSCKNQQLSICTVQASASKRLGTLMKREDVEEGWRCVRSSIAGKRSNGGSCTNQQPPCTAYGGVRLALCHGVQPKEGKGGETN